MASALTFTEDTWQGEDTSIAEIERELARLREGSVREGGQPNLRTSVMTHLAWAPPEWQHAAEETLAGMGERHPSRTLLLLPRPEEPDGRSDPCWAYGPAGWRGVSAELPRPICQETAL